MDTNQPDARDVLIPVLRSRNKPSVLADKCLAALTEAHLRVVPSIVSQCPGCDRWHDDLVCPYCGTEFDGRAR
jgi:hypothetical protein